MNVALSLATAEATVFAVLLLIFAVIRALETVRNWREERRRRHEADLDAKAEQLRRAVLALAEDLAASRDQASRALVRAAFLSRASDRK